VRLPWQLLVDVALVGQAEPVRLQVFVALCVAALVAMWLDHLAEQGAGPAVALAAAGTAAAVATWIPADTQDVVPATSRRSSGRGHELAPTTSWRPSRGSAAPGSAAPSRCSGRPPAAWPTGPTAATSSASDPRTPCCWKPRRNAYDTVANASAAGQPGPPRRPRRMALHDLRAEG